jgi:hypothetical protein
VRAAVIGAGIFGCVTAVELARNGFEVDLYDRHSRILQGASQANCARLHHGYHYPRVPQPDMARHAARFAARFPGTVDRSASHHYCVARDGSRTTAAEFLDFCDRLGLPYEVATPPQVRDSVDVCVRVPESAVDVDALRDVLRRELLAARVMFYPQSDVTPDDLAGYDWIIQATYGRDSGRVLRWEVCETALVRLGEHFAGLSFVVLDGPFACIDPEPGTDQHVLYDVVNSVHANNVGFAPEIPAHLAELVDRGPVFTDYTRVEAMLHTASRFFDIGTPRYCGSRFTVRAVLPDVDATDERPTLVERDGNVVRILSGKIDSAVWAAEMVAAIVREAVPVA